MRVPQIRPSAGGAPITRVSSPPRAAGAASNTASAARPRELSDTSSILGIPVGELTPKVQAAIVTLMEEVQQLRQQLEVTQVQLAEVARLADQDALTPDIQPSRLCA